MCCYFSGDIKISRLLFVSPSFSLFSVLPTEEILSAISFPVKFPVASAVFWTTPLDAVFAAIFCRID